jgi:hypothetical protein
VANRKGTKTVVVTSGDVIVPSLATSDFVTISPKGRDPYEVNTKTKWKVVVVPSSAKKPRGLHDLNLRLQGYLEPLQGETDSNEDSDTAVVS